MYNGLYDVTLIAEDITNGCGFDTLKKEDLIYCAGGPNLSIIKISNNINVFPNPSYENITISSNFQINSPTIINIFNLSGKLIISNNVEMKNGFSESINISSLVTGFYLLEIKNSLFENQMFHFIKK